MDMTPAGQRSTERLNGLQLVLAQLPLKALRLQRADLPQKTSSRDTWGDSATLGAMGMALFSWSGLCVVGTAVRHIC